MRGYSADASPLRPTIPDAPEALNKVIHTAMEGGMYVSRALAQELDLHL